MSVGSASSQWWPTSGLRSCKLHLHYQHFSLLPYSTLPPSCSVGTVRNWPAQHSFPQAGSCVHAATRVVAGGGEVAAVQAAQLEAAWLTVLLPVPTKSSCLSPSMYHGISQYVLFILQNVHLKIPMSPSYLLGSYRSMRTTKS